MFFKNQEMEEGEYMKVHILTDNRVKKSGMLAEHGLSIFIEHKGMRILFDTGQTNVYCHNAKKMSLDLSLTDFIVLSHGHYDHCGGLANYPNLDQLPTIYIHEEALCKRYALNSDKVTYREIGIPWDVSDRSKIEKRLVYVKKSIEVAPDIMIIGEVPNFTSFEDIPKGFFIERHGEKVVDMMKDEQMLVFNTDKGLVVFLGCSHPGIINCLTYILKLFPEKSIYTLVAGMHLDNISPLRLQMTIQSLLDMNIQNVVPLHCTGMLSICEMKRYLGDRCHPLIAGDTIEI